MLWRGVCCERVIELGTAHKGESLPSCVCIRSKNEQHGQQGRKCRAAEKMRGPAAQPALGLKKFAHADHHIPFFLDIMVICVCRFF